MDRRFILFLVVMTASFWAIRAGFDVYQPAPAVKKEAPKPLKEAAKESSRFEVKPVKNHEEYFVLENEYQQLVFSSKGGAIVEINLPFTDKKTTQTRSGFRVL